MCPTVPTPQGPRPDRRLDPLRRGTKDRTDEVEKCERQREQEPVESLSFLNPELCVGSDTRDWTHFFCGLTLQRCVSLDVGYGRPLNPEPTNCPPRGREPSTPTPTLVHRVPDRSERGIGVVHVEGGRSRTNDIKKIFRRDFPGRLGVRSRILYEVRILSLSSRARARVGGRRVQVLSPSVAPEH